MARDKDDASRSRIEDLEMFLPARPQHKGRITTGIARQVGELIQNLAPFLLGGLLEYGSQLSYRRVSFLHGEPHG
jgi:hypothetical protein